MTQINISEYSQQVFSILADLSYDGGKGATLFCGYLYGVAKLAPNEGQSFTDYMRQAFSGLSGEQQDKVLAGLRNEKYQVFADRLCAYPQQRECGRQLDGINRYIIDLMAELRQALAGCGLLAFDGRELPLDELEIVSMATFVMRRNEKKELLAAIKNAFDQMLTAGGQHIEIITTIETAYHTWKKLVCENFVLNLIAIISTYSIEELIKIHRFLSVESNVTVNLLCYSVEAVIGEKLWIRQNPDPENINPSLNFSQDVDPAQIGVYYRQLRNLFFGIPQIFSSGDQIILERISLWTANNYETLSAFARNGQFKEAQLEAIVAAALEQNANYYKISTASLVASIMKKLSVQTV